MKKSLIILAMLAAFGAQAQESTSNSGSQSGSTSNSGAAAIGNVNTNDATAQSGSQSQSGAQSGSQSGAVGNSVYVDQRGPTSQTVNATSNSNSTSNVNEKSDVTVRNIQSGSSTQSVVTSGGTNDRTEVHYSGTQTVKNVPGIAMSGPASGPCTGASGGLGLAGPGFGVGLNAAKVEPSCVVRENVRVIGMAMQSLDGAAFPGEKAELMQMMMNAVRGLGAMNDAIIGDNMKR